MIRFCEWFEGVDFDSHIEMETRAVGETSRTLHSNGDGELCVILLKLAFSLVPLHQQEGDPTY